jgi:hypothetical protein
MWEAADGKSMGRQKIYDKRLNITTEWFNRGNSWASQIRVARNDSVNTGLVLYFAAQVGGFYWRCFKYLRKMKKRGFCKKLRISVSLVCFPRVLEK